MSNLAAISSSNLSDDSSPCYPFPKPTVRYDYTLYGSRFQVGKKTDDEVLQDCLDTIGIINSDVFITISYLVPIGATSKTSSNLCRFKRFVTELIFAPQTSSCPEVVVETKLRELHYFFPSVVSLTSQSMT